MRVGIPKETHPRETRTAATPDSVKKLCKKGLTVLLEKSTGERAGFPDTAYQTEGGILVNTQEAWGAEIVLRVNKPSLAEISLIKQGSLFISFLEPFHSDRTLDHLAQAGISSIAMELIPRTSRAQSMDALSSQASVAGYRAVIEAAYHYGRFFSMLMTAAGSTKPAHVVVLGAGVAGLQAISTARRLGAVVEAYDIRPEVKEQVESLGAKFINFPVSAMAPSDEAYGYTHGQRQQELLAEKLKKADIIITTASVPGQKAPLLISEQIVQAMKKGSVIIDLAASSGGNCALTEVDRVVVKNGITLVGYTHMPALVPNDASSFYARNIFNLLELILKDRESSEVPVIHFPLEDDIVAACLVTHQGIVRWNKN